MSEEKFEYKITHRDETIEGLDELRAAIDAWKVYRDCFKKWLDGYIHDRPALPEANIKELEEKYPRAAAYRTAEVWANSTSLAKARFGLQACGRILAGEDHNEVLKDMNNAWAAFRVAQGEG